jgi:transmembrane sensor
MEIKGVNELLERYRNNKCTAEDRKILEQWFDAQSEAGNWEWTKDEEQASGMIMKQRIDRQLAVKQKSWSIILKVAAMLAVLLFSFFYYRAEIYNIVDPVVYLEKQVPDGKQLKLTLADGSKVWLNANSRFKYPKEFNRSRREVFLIEGEAYFDVSHDEKKPFIVISKKLSTQVLGTAFNVRAYRYLSNIQVAVARGKVSVSENDPQNDGKTNSIILLPNEQVSVTASIGVMQKQAIDADNVIAWQKGNLSFNNDLFLDVCTVLARKFKVKIHFEQDSLKEYRLTASFARTDRLEDILLVLSSANHLTYQFKGNAILFNQK